MSIFTAFLKNWNFCSKTLNRFKPPSKMFYWPFQVGTSFVDLLCFCSVLCLLCFVRVCLYVLRGHLLGKGWPLGSRLWCLLWVCHFPIGILGQVWYLIVSIPDLCNLTYFCSKIRISKVTDYAALNVENDWHWIFKGIRYMGLFGSYIEYLWISNAKHLTFTAETIQRVNPFDTADWADIVDPNTMTFSTIKSVRVYLKKWGVK